MKAGASPLFVYLQQFFLVRDFCHTVASTTSYQFVLGERRPLLASEVTRS
jgi:hypothetical protein